MYVGGVLKAFLVIVEFCNESGILSIALLRVVVVLAYVVIHLHYIHSMAQLAIVVIIHLYISI